MHKKDKHTCTLCIQTLLEEKSKLKKSTRALGIVGTFRCWPRLYVLLHNVVFLCLIFGENDIIT